MNDRRAALAALDQRIEARCRAIASLHGAWPCRRGCDACCRSLGELPHATRPEWERLAEGLALLGPAVRGEIAGRVAALALAPERQPVVCPFLDCASGACLVYDHRLLACRAYGFFVSGGDGRWCTAVASVLPESATPPVLGNLDSVLAEARHLAGGETLTLLDWWPR